MGQSVFDLPLMQRLLEPPDMQRLSGHPDEGHYFEELFLVGFDQLAYIVATEIDERSEVVQQVGPIQECV